MQFVYGWPDYDCAVSNLEWEIGTARVLGLPVPSLAPYLGMVIGRSSLRVDAHGDNLARVETEGGYWRWAHDGWLQRRTTDFPWSHFGENHWVRILLAGTSPR